MTRQTVRAMALLAMALPTAAAMAQFTGTSHPDEIPVSTSSEGISQPVVYTPTPAMQTRAVVAAPALKLHTEVAATTLPETRATSSSAADSMVVGDNGRGMAHLAAAAIETIPTTTDIDADVVTHVDGVANGLPVGTLVKARMMEGFTTKTSAEGAEWTAAILEPVERDGRVLIPAGSTLRGKVTEIHGGRRISGEAAIHLLPLTVTLPDGSSLGIHAQVIDTSLYHSTKVDEEGTILRRDHRKEEAGVLALTTGSGAAAGALIAGVPGALVGAGVGAGVSTVIWLKQDRQTEIPAGTRITFELTRTLIVGDAVR